MAMDAMMSLFSVWPNASQLAPESNDGQPLAQSIPDLFWNFPYERLPTSHKLVGYFMRPEVMFLWVLLYLSSQVPLKDAVEKFGITGKSTLFRATVAVHNFGLAIFSFIVMIQSWPIVISHYKEHGLEATYCDQLGTLWTNSGFGSWATIFYISKYYEFIDTWILIFKRKEPSFLQTYHHAGIVFTMWGGVASQSAWLLFVVLLNSFIHTLMYTYFLIKTISPTTEIKSAKYLTSAQIAQFITGITCTIPVLLMGEQCDSQSSRFMLACLQVYGYGLVALFAAFASKKYKKKKKE